MNKGELDEYMCILRLIELRQNGETLFFDKINSVKSNGVELNDLPFDINLSHLRLENEILNIAKHCNFKKSPSNSKADIHINGIGFSIKSNRSSPPAIVNHTTRFGFVNVCKRLDVDIHQLDSIIDEYWIKRKKGILNNKILYSSKNDLITKKIPFVTQISIRDYTYKSSLKT